MSLSTTRSIAKKKKNEKKAPNVAASESDKARCIDLMISVSIIIVNIYI